MPNFSVSTDTFTVRPVRQDEVLAPQKMGRGPDLSYMSLPDGPRQFNQRAALGGAAAAVFSQAAAALNEGAISVWLRKWLQANETKIGQALLQHRHNAFALQVNYAVANSFGNQMFLSRDIYLLGTAPTAKDIGTVLTPDVMFGPKADVTTNYATKLQYAYLVGERR